MTSGPFRSLLFAPGNHPRRAEKAFTVGADVAILDLEDAVAVAEKPAARTAVVEALKRPRQCLGYVRVNAFDTEFCHGDIEAVAGPWLDGVVLPKVETRAALLTVEEWIAAQEQAHGMPPGTIDILPIIETARGLTDVDTITGAGSRVRRLSFGAVDFAKDLGMGTSMDEWELTPARAAIALASRVAGLEAPLDSVWVHFRDTDGLRRSAERVRVMGYQGKLCIHPDQVQPINEVFTPSAEEIERAEKIVAAFEKAEAKGSASITVDGYFVDYPVVHQARRTLDLIKRIHS